MSRLYPFCAYLRYRKNAVTKHGIHSPFVFELATKVFPPVDENFDDHPAEKWRSECLGNSATIHVQDFGTGASGPKKISAIASRAAKSPNAGQLLHRITRRFRPKKILELGTSLGITSLYQLKAAPFEQFITLEGCPETAAKAKEIFQRHLLNVDMRTGEFSETLGDALQTLGQVDQVYFDGNHREGPTLAYFEKCLPYKHPGSVFIFDDIHWSREMELAWEKIKVHPEVTLTIDVFHFGLVFFRKEQKEKQHFVVRW